MYLAVVGLLSRALEGVCIPLSFTQSSGVKRSSVVRRGGVRRGVLVDPDDPRAPLDGDLGRLEAEVLDQDLLRRMLGCPGGATQRRRPARSPQPAPPPSSTRSCAS
jgi:hypothetical protein